MSNILSRKLTNMLDKVKFYEGGETFEMDYPKGIPAQVKIDFGDKQYKSNYMTLPLGHAKNKSFDCLKLIRHKFDLMNSHSFSSQIRGNDYVDVLLNLETLTNKDIRKLYNS